MPGYRRSRLAGSRCWMYGSGPRGMRILTLHVERHVTCTHTYIYICIYIYMCIYIYIYMHRYKITYAHIRMNEGSWTRLPNSDQHKYVGIYMYLHVCKQHTNETGCVPAEFAHLRFHRRCVMHTHSIRLPSYMVKLHACSRSLPDIWAAVGGYARGIVALS